MFTPARLKKENIEWAAWDDDVISRGNYAVVRSKEILRPSAH